jgi:hypothetical protein
VLVMIWVERLYAETASPQKVKWRQRIRSQTDFELTIFGIQITCFTNETIHK